MNWHGNSERKTWCCVQGGIWTSGRWDHRDGFRASPGRAGAGLVHDHDVARAVRVDREPDPRANFVAKEDSATEPPFDEEPEPIVVPIEESIDLHHFRPSEILDVVDAYIDAALERGFREVRLIHGKGKGVQRANIRRFLEADPRVERFAEPTQGRGGWGATLVWLKDPTI